MSDETGRRELRLLAAQLSAESERREREACTVRFSIAGEEYEFAATRAARKAAADRLRTCSPRPEILGNRAFMSAFEDFISNVIGDCSFREEDATPEGFDAHCAILAALIDGPSCAAEDCGCFQPKHPFRRIRCSACGGMHWEPRQKALGFAFCPHCGMKITDAIAAETAMPSRKGE